MEQFTDTEQTLQQKPRDVLNEKAGILGVEAPASLGTKKEVYDAMVASADLPDPSLRGKSSIEAPVSVVWDLADQMIVQKREEVKSQAVESARRKIGDVLWIEDLVLQDINLTRALENAIEAKMVQEQEAARARFAQQQAQIEASTAVIKAKGEAESIVVRGRALQENPSVMELQIIEHWDGVTPLVVGPGVTGANMVLPLGDFNIGAASQKGGQQ